mgnify:FL=1
MKEANKIAKYLTDISEVDVFANSRRRENIDVRSLLTFILRNHLGMTFHQIKNFYENNGKHYDHATAMHSLKTFEVNRRYSKSLDEWLKKIQFLIRDKSNIKKGMLEHKLQYLHSNDINKLLKIVNDMPQKEIDGERQTKEKATTDI